VVRWISGVWAVLSSRCALVNARGIQNLNWLSYYW
jgi:hypothetical protein